MRHLGYHTTVRCVSQIGVTTQALTKKSSHTIYTHLICGYIMPGAHPERPREDGDPNDRMQTALLRPAKRTFYIYVCNLHMYLKERGNHLGAYEHTTQEDLSVSINMLDIAS